MSLFDRTEFIQNTVSACTVLRRKSNILVELDILATMYTTVAAK